jgi:hypothetical protein
MTVDIFSNWLNKWDKQLGKEKRLILITIDNCPANPSIQNVSTS